jgi:hypothetical protein
LGKLKKKSCPDNTKANYILNSLRKLKKNPGLDLQTENAGCAIQLSRSTYESNLNLTTRRIKISWIDA